MEPLFKMAEAHEEVRAKGEAAQERADSSEVLEDFLPYNELLRRKEELLALITDAEREVHQINNELASRQHECFDEDS